MDPEKWSTTRESPTSLNKNLNYKTETFWTYRHWVWSNKWKTCKDGICWTHHCCGKQFYEFRWYKRLFTFLVAIIFRTTLLLEEILLMLMIWKTLKFCSGLNRSLIIIMSTNHNSKIKISGKNCENIYNKIGCYCEQYNKECFHSWCKWELLSLCLNLIATTICRQFFSKNWHIYVWKLEKYQPNKS